jgi:hypothetical protein
VTSASVHLPCIPGTGPNRRERAVLSIHPVDRRKRGPGWSRVPTMRSSTNPCAHKTTLHGGWPSLPGVRNAAVSAVLLYPRTNAMPHPRRVDEEVFKLGDAIGDQVYVAKPTTASTTPPGDPRLSLRAPLSESVSHSGLSGAVHDRSHSTAMLSGTRSSAFVMMPLTAGLAGTPIASR